MTVIKYYRLYCNECGEQYCEIDDKIQSLRTYAKFDGWKYIKVLNGSYWDFCPRCYNNYIKENKNDNN